jgi:hypothetical protein
MEYTEEKILEFELFQFVFEGELAGIKRIGPFSIKAVRVI